MRTARVLLLQIRAPSVPGPVASLAHNTSPPWLIHLLVIPRPLEPEIACCLDLATFEAFP